MTEKIAIQDRYGERFQHCWGCGAKNEEGLHLKSYPSPDGSGCETRITPDQRFTGGVPANLFGGMIASLFDCHGTASAAWFFLKEQGGSLETSETIQRFITAHLEIDFKKPVPMNREIRICSRLLELSARKVILEMELTVKEMLCARAKMVAVAAKKEM